MPVPPPVGAKKVFEGDLATAYQWSQELYDGTTKMFECYTRPDVVAIIPFLDRNTILLTKQEQPGRPEPFWDVAGGRVDPGEAHEDAIRREFQEETGYRAGRLVPWYHSRNVGMVRFEHIIYVATDLALDPVGNHEDAGERIEVVPTSWSEAISLSYRRVLRNKEAMLILLAMEHDPEERARLEAFLSKTK